MYVSPLPRDNKQANDQDRIASALALSPFKNNLIMAGPKSKKPKAGTPNIPSTGASDGAATANSSTTPVIASADDTVTISTGPPPGDALVTPPSVPTLSTTTPAPTDAIPDSITAPATQMLPPSTSELRRLLVGDYVTLHFTAADAALGDGLIGREFLNVEDDDFEAMKNGSQPAEWVKKFVEAFGQDYLLDPEDTTRSPAQKEWFRRWQKTAHVSLVAIFEMKGPNHLEKCCWYLFDTIIKAHELGVFTIANQWMPSKLKCSKRLAAVVSIIEKYALMRLDVLRLWHIDEIATNPEFFIKRKLTNCWNNGHRAEKDAKARAYRKAAVSEGGEKSEEAQLTVETGEQTSQPQHGTASSPAKANDAIPPQTPDETRAATVDGTTGKGKDRAKRARSVTPGGSGVNVNKSTAPNKRPTGRKAVVKCGVKSRSGAKVIADGDGVEE